MSKLYKKYVTLKEENNNKIYLFRNGIFYIFLDDDAKKMSSLLNLRLTNLNESVVKCGFPVNNLNKYLDLIKNNHYEISILDSVESKPCSSEHYLLNTDAKDLILSLAKVDSNSLSISEVYSLVEDATKKAKSIVKELENE